MFQLLSTQYTLIALAIYFVLAKFVLVNVCFNGNIRFRPYYSKRNFNEAQKEIIDALVKKYFDIFFQN